MDNKADKKKPVKPPECLFRDEQNPTLDELIGQITPENRHPETDWGPGVGREKLYW
jgi:antitoxin component of MazEF toxin-antitoxin module